MSGTNASTTASDNTYGWLSMQVALQSKQVKYGIALLTRQSGEPADSTRDTVQLLE